VALDATHPQALRDSEQGEVAQHDFLKQRFDPEAVFLDVHFWLDDESKSQFDTLLKLKNLQNRIEINRAGIDFDGTRIAALFSIPGFFLYGECQGKQKDIYAFLVKFAYFKQKVLRPLECLLLVAGVVVECQGRPFTPNNFASKLDHVLFRRKCTSCAKEIEVGGKYCTHEQSQCSFVGCNKCALKHTHHGKNLACLHSELIPNLPLATLLLAGRVESTNEVNSGVKRASSERDTNLREEGRVKLQKVTEQWNAEKTRADAEKTRADKLEQRLKEMEEKQQGK
jgi:hypothetical protein